MQTIENALKRGARTLSEHESKALLAEYGIPVTREKTVASVGEAVTAASEIGYPVVLKGCGEALSHKTELNMIVLNLKNENEVIKAYEQLTNNPEACLESVLVQQMIQGDRELVAGMTRDQEFGPCVMFGIGGIFTEILEDIAFRAAPLNREDAMDMMEEIRGKKILTAIRGKAAIDREALADILVALGRIATENGAIKEIDMNPLKFIDGKSVAVDSLVVLG